MTRADLIARLRELADYAEPREWDLPLDLADVLREAADALEITRKACPLLVQSDTSPSLTVPGESHTRTFFLECLGGQCAAFVSGRCKRFKEVQP